MDPKLLAKYRAPQKRPTFFAPAPTPEEEEESKWGGRLALLALGFFVLGFVAFFAFTVLKPF